MQAQFEQQFVRQCNARLAALEQSLDRLQNAQWFTVGEADDNLAALDRCTRQYCALKDEIDALLRAVTELPFQRWTQFTYNALADNLRRIARDADNTCRNLGTSTQDKTVRSNNRETRIEAVYQAELQEREEERKAQAPGGKEEN